MLTEITSKSRDKKETIVMYKQQQRVRNKSNIRLILIEADVKGKEEDRANFFYIIQFIFFSFAILLKQVAKNKE